MSDTLIPTPDLAQEDKAARREARIANALDAADQAPNPEAPAELTEADQAGIDRLHASEDPAKHILDLREQDQARRAAADAARLEALKAHEAAGGVVYTDGQTPDAIATPAPEAAAEQPTVKKRSILDKLLGRNK